MKITRSSFLIGSIVVALTSTSFLASAQTTDGVTPAQESVCDALQAEGVSKGLYGLCVAFCEARDTADAADPLSRERLDTIAAGSPSGKILENYNSRKTDNDPDMPCISNQHSGEVCPCWSAEQFATIDGVLGDGNAPIFDCFGAGVVNGDGGLELSFVGISEMRNFNFDNESTAAGGLIEGSPVCYSVFDSGVFTRVSAAEGDAITPEQANECLIQAKQACESFGLSY